MSAAEEPPQSVLFVCTRNAIRSQMAAGLARLRFAHLRVDSAGVRPDEDVAGLTIAVMDEKGVDLTRTRTKGLDVLTEAIREGDAEPFDLVVTLSPEAHHQALDRGPALGKTVEYWPTFDPSYAEGSREQVLEEYRAVRDGLDRRIAQRFPRPSTG